jgi:uncharacterized protein YggE
MAIDQPIPRLITVWGDAEINVAPDKVTLALGVDTWDKDLDTSTKRNDERIREVLRLLSSHQIPSADIQTSYMEIEPTYDTRYDKRNNPTEKVLTGYRVQKTVVVTVKDLSKFEEVLSAVQKDGANRLYGVQFATSELRKYRDEARAKAIRAAKEKAEALTREIGQKIGKAYTIEEEQARSWDTSMRNVSQNVASHAEPEGSGSILAPGLIRVNSRIKVSFELE